MLDSRRALKLFYSKYSSALSITPGMVNQQAEFIDILFYYCSI
jgi:hypothetical protein